MSSCSSDFEDCSDELVKVAHTKKKWKRNRVNSGKKEYYKSNDKAKISLKNTNRIIRTKKLSTKVREFERSNKSSQIEQIESRNNNINNNNNNQNIDSNEQLLNNDLPTININADLLNLNLNDNFNENASVASNLTSEINKISKDGATDSDDSDKNERVKYIKLLSKLIDLNMPSKIESNRSNEAYTRRQCFLEKRRYNSDKTESCYPLFCREAFWLELQHRVKSRKDDRIKKMKDKTVSILKELMQFKVEDVDVEDCELPKEKIYAISKPYLTKIKNAHKQLSDLMGRYYYYLSFWSTTATMRNSIIDANPNYIEYYQTITENIDTMQAWQNCCQWLNWKTRQICLLVGIYGNALNNFVIIGHHQNNSSNITVDNTEFNFEEKFSNSTECGDTNCESRNHSADKYRLRSHSLNMAMDYINSTNIVTSDSSLENLSDSDYESKFETYADINRRRYGMEKVCSSAINSVSEMLDKYKNLFSITKDENTLPLMHSYAEAVKDGINCPTCINTQNGKQLIYTENLSEASNSSYQTAKPVFDDNQEFPTIQSLRPCNISLFSSPSLSSNPSMSHIVQEDIPDASDETIMDLLRKKFEMESINYPREPDTFRESKGLFGLRNQVAARLSLPPLLPHYLFLVKFPIKLMHCCIRKILGSPDISKISELSVITIKQRIIDFKDALQFTMRARQFLFDYTFGINFQINKFLASNSKDFAPKQDVDLSDFLSSSMKEIDGDLSSLLRHYIDCLKELLKKWSKSSTSCKFEYGEPRKLLEEEWTFVKTYCHNIKQEEEIVASSFCNLAEYLFDLLQSRIESDYKLNIDVDNSPNDSPSLSNAEEDILSVSSINNRRMSKCCQTYNNKCKMIQSQLKQAADFSKMLRSDLEISIQLELNLNYSMNDLLSFLSLTKHKMIDLCSSDEQSSINPIDLTLIIPEESSSFIKELLDPLITGFSIHPKDDTVRTTLLNSSSSKPRCIKSREYILIINKKSKINWPGEKIKFIYQLDIGNLKQRIESSNIVFLARRPDELTEQLSHLLEFKIPSKHHNIQFKNVIQSCSEGQVEACHYNSKRTLNALKSKAIEIGQVLHNFFMYDKNDSFSVSELNKIQEETVRNSIKNSYSIIFEFYRDLIKLCTGDAFKTVLKNTIVGLLEKWFEFSRKFEPSEKGTVPRWANDGLNFLLQLCQSRVVMTMTKKEWHDFKKSIDNFVEFIVGKSNRHHSTTSGKSTTNSSKVVTGRSWLVTPKPDVIRGCENNASNSKKIENWDIKCDNRTLRSAFSEPSRMISSDQNSFPNQLDRHIDMKTPGNFNEISFTRSITVAEQGLEHSRDAPNSNKSTDGSSNEDHKDRKRVTLKQAIVELENQLNEKRRQNNLMGFVRDSNSDNTSSCYIKKAPFQWIKKGLIGQGHAGTVFKVCNLDTMEIMAMKEIVINEPFSQDLIECDLLCKLNHASLLKYHGVDISLSHMRIFTEYCEGGSLSQVSILDIPEINLRQWTKQILEAIMHLHSHKIVHRDVKPDNIFLKNIEGTNECHAKLGDFGVAKCLVNHLDGLKDIKGTVMYMAPEVAVVDSEQNKSKHGYNHKVDIWSLGCMVLYMITGKPPWDEYQHLAIYYNLGMKKLPFIPAVDSTARMTKEARDFIVGCLKINPDERLEALDLLNFNFVKLRNH